MKKFSLILTVLVILAFVIGIAAPALANPGVEVVPSWHDFGDVKLGFSSTTIITVSNVGGHDLAVNGIGLGGSSDFSITMAPDLPAVVDSGGDSVKVEVTFTPYSKGYAAGVLEIASNDPDDALVTVGLGGVGIAVRPSPVTINDILAFFDASVKAGILEGRGRVPRIIKARLMAFRPLLVATGTLIEGDCYDWACHVLQYAFIHSDGLHWPRDFVDGEARAELNGMILQLMIDRGCE